MIGTHSTIDAELQALKDHIEHHRTVLTNEGIWFFLTIIGCWGISDGIFQIFAYIFIFYIFARQVDSKRKDPRPHDELIKVVKSRIEKSLQGKDRADKLNELAAIQKKYLSTFRVMREGKIFLFCWIFYCLSFFYAITHFSTSPKITNLIRLAVKFIAEKISFN